MQLKLLPQSYLVEKIIGLKMMNHKVYFKVKWENYSVEESTWEPLENLKNCILLNNFIDDVYRDLNHYIINTNLKLFQKELNIELSSKYPENNIFQDLESTTEDLELKSLQILYNLMIKNGFNPNDEFRLFYMEVFKQSRLKTHLNRLTTLLTSIEDKFSIIVENKVDFDLPPPFQYITKNKISREIVINKRSQFGCYCYNNCSGTTCCPRSLIKFKDEKKRKSLKDCQIKYECSEECSCDVTCNNRTTQQKSSISLSLFKTNNNRGWGVKSKSNIQYNTFIIEYLGKVIDQIKTCQKSSTYMYDILTPHKTKDFYTIDATKYGNLSRFLNHSCNPNCTIWRVLQCNTNPKLFKLCFYSKRYIPPNEELTIDYNGIDYPVNRSHKFAKSSMKCLCGSSKCRGYIFWE